MARFGMDRGATGGFGHDFSEFIMASGSQPAYGGMQRPAVQQQQQQHGSHVGDGGGVGRGGQRKAPPGHKLCDKCGEASPVRYPNCKECNEPFPMGIRKQKRIRAAEQAQMKEQAMRAHYHQQHPQQQQQQQQQQHDQQHPQQQQQQQQQQHDQQPFMPQQPLLSGFPVPLTPNYPSQFPRVQSVPTRPVVTTSYNQQSTPLGGGGGGDGGLMLVFPSTDRLSVGNDADDDQSIPSLQSLPSEESPKQAQSAPSDVRQLSLTNGKQILFFVHNGVAHLSFPDLQSMMPQNLRQVLEKILTTMDFSPDDAKRGEILLLASRKVVSDTETTVQLYPASDVQKMFTILNLPVPDFILRAAQGEFPQERVDMSEFQNDEAASPVSSPWIPTLFSKDKKDPPSSLALNEHGPPVGSHFVSPSLPSRGVSSAYHAHEGRITSAAFKESKIGSDITYGTMPWRTETLTVLYPKNKEPYVCITELNRKLLQVGTKKCQQRRFSLGIDSIPTTAEQVHQLKALGSLSEKVVYTRLLRLREACKLSESFGLLVPENVNNEWRKYFHFSKEQSGDHVFEGEDLPSMSGSHDHLDSPTTVMMVDDGLDTEEPIEDDVKELQDGNFYHPDFINLDDDSCSEEGMMKQFRWNGRIYTTFTTRHNIHYLTLAELYDHFLQPKGVTKVNMTYRMRKLNLRTIRSSSWVRLRMIILGSHSPHIPVCCLLQMEDCVKLLKCFHIQLPPILKKVFLIGNKKIYKHKLVCQESESLVVKVPRSHCSQFPPVKEPVNQSQIDIMEQKHVPQAGTATTPAGAQVIRDAQGAARRCPHCKHLTPVVKKRCQSCKAFLVGLPCPSCGILNHNRSSYCWKCNSPLEFRETASASSPRKQHIIGSKVQVAQSVSAVYTDSDDGSNDEGKPTAGHHKNQSSSATQLSRVTAFKTPTAGDGNKAQMGIRTCGECGQSNSNKSKKCYRCSRPLIGRPCLSCGRPNHSHSVQCWKCGSSIASSLKGSKETPTSSDTLGRYKKSRQLGHNQIRRRSTADSTLLKDLERNRAQAFCIRCHSFRCSGRFRCGRCGDVFLTKPAFDNEPDDEEGGPSGEGKSGASLATSSPSQNLEGAQKVTSSDKVEQDAPTAAKPQDSSPLQKDGQQQQSRKLEDLAEVAPPPDSVMLTFGKAVYGSGVGRKIAEMLEADEKDIGQHLPTAEQQYKDAKSLHDRFRHKHRTELSRIQDRQATLDGLIARSDLLVSKLHKLSSKESGSLVLLKELPSSYQTLKREIEHKAKLLASLDKHLMGPLALAARQDDLGERDKLISAIETTLNDEQREDGEVFAASPIANGAADTALAQFDDRRLMDHGEYAQNGLPSENGNEPQEAIAVEADECMEVDPKATESPKRVQQEMEVDGAAQQELVMEGQEAEADEQGMELPSLGVPCASVNALAQEGGVSSVDAAPTGGALEVNNEGTSVPTADLKGPEMDMGTQPAQYETHSTEAKTATADKEAPIDLEVVKVKAFSADLEGPHTEPETPNTEVKTESTKAESQGVQLAVSEDEPDREVEGTLQRNAVDTLPLLNYSNSPDIVSQQAGESAVQQDSAKDGGEAVNSAKTVALGTDRQPEEATSIESIGEAEQKVCETPEVSPASDGVSSPLGLEPPTNAHKVPTLISDQGRRHSSPHEQESEEHGEGSPPPAKVRKLSDDTLSQVKKDESSEASVSEGSLDPLAREHEEITATTRVDETDREAKWQQQVDSVPEMGTITSTRSGEEDVGSPMDSSCTNIDETAEEAVSRSPGQAGEEPADVGSSMGSPVVKSHTEESKSPVEVAKSPVTPIPIPTASEGSTGAAGDTLVSPQPVKSPIPTYSGRKRSKSADSPVNGDESSVGSKRRHSMSNNTSVKSPVDSNMPQEDASKVPLEEEVHEAIGQPDQRTDMDVGEIHPPLEGAAQQVVGTQSPMTEEAFSPVSSTEDATSLAAENDESKPGDAASVIQKDSLNADEVRSEQVADRGDDAVTLPPMPLEETVERSPNESTDGVLLSETYTEVDRVLSPILEEASQDLLECDTDEQEGAPPENNPADVSDSSDLMVRSVEAESPEDERKSLELQAVEPNGSKFSEQQLVDETRTQTVEHSRSLEVRDDTSMDPSKEASPVPSEGEPVPPGTEGDAADEEEYEAGHLLLSRRQTKSASVSDSTEPEEVEMETSTSVEAAGTEHEELVMDCDTHVCSTDEDVLHDRVDNSAAVDDMDTEEHTADLLQFQEESHLRTSEEPSFVSGDHSDLSSLQPSATGEDDEEDTVDGLQQGLGSDEVASLVNTAEVPSTSAESVAASDEPLRAAAEVVDSPKEAVLSQTEPVTPPGESMASSTEPITPPRELAISPAEPVISLVSSSKEPMTSPLHSPNEPVTSPLHSPKEPVTSPLHSPKEPVTSPLHSPKEPVTSPVNLPLEPVTSPKEPVIPVHSLKEPVTSPVTPPVHSPKETVTSPVTPPVHSPKETVTSPVSSPVHSPKEPVTSPVHSPKEPVTLPVISPVHSPKEPVTSPVTSPVHSDKEPVNSSKEPFTSPATSPITSPVHPAEEPVSSSKEPFTSPATSPITSPVHPAEEPVSSSKSPVISPEDPDPCATVHTSSPEDPVLTHTEPPSFAEEAAAHSQPPPADVPVECGGQAQYKGLGGSESEDKDEPQSPVHAAPLEEGLLDDLLDETGQVTQGGSEEEHEIHPGDVSLLDDDSSVDGQLAEPAVDSEKAEQGSDRHAEQKQGSVSEDVKEEVEQLTANESGTKDTSEKEEKCAGEGEESVDFRCSVDTSGPSTSEQVHEGEDVLLGREAHSYPSTAPALAQEPEESNPGQSENEEEGGGTSGTSAIRGLVAYGDSGSSSEDENTEETDSISASVPSAVGVQPETGEQLHEGSHGDTPQEAARPPSSTGEATRQNKEGSPSNAENGEEEMDTSNVAEEDCSDEMDLS